jgi:transposase
VGDKGYDREANRSAARQRGICPVIPYKSSAKNRPTFFPKALYRARARIEQLVGKLKRFKRMALRCEKTNKNFGSFVAFALGLIIINRPHGLAQLTLLFRQTEPPLLPGGTAAQ